MSVFANVFRIPLLLVAILVMTLAAPEALAHPGAAAAKSSSAKKTRSKAKKKQRRARKKKRTKRRRKRRRRRSSFRGHGVAKSKLRTEPLPKPSGNIWVYAPNHREEVRVNIYDDKGEIDDAALAQLDGNFRCKRTGETRAVDPRLYEVLSIISDHFGGKRVELISGFRFQKNEGSRHYHASAMDIRVPGVSTTALYKFAETLDTGGMGIGRYPRSGFVHIDFRAPGEPSYRWVDRSRPGTGSRGSSTSRRFKRRGGRPNS